ncbi:MAG TPA: helix-turn-helix domain-containing protein [Terriglobales bacterium]|nr:helix-turn-helix domain-containing protein [Terriglobales bacterium]
MTRTNNHQKLTDLLDARHRHRDRSAKVRIDVMVLTLRGELTAAQIAMRLRVARSTVFEYRRLYRQRGVEGLLMRLKPGRPSLQPSAALESIIVQGLQKMRWFHLQTLQDWIRHHDYAYHDWTVRRWARALIQRLGIRFLVDWQNQRQVSFDTFQDSEERKQQVALRRQMRMINSSLQTTLDLVFEATGQARGRERAA